MQWARNRAGNRIALRAESVEGELVTTPLVSVGTSVGTSTFFMGLHASYHVGRK